MAHFNARPARASYALPYPGQVYSNPLPGDLVKVLSGDLRGDLGIVRDYIAGSTAPYTVKVGATEYQFNSTQILPVA